MKNSRSVFTLAIIILSVFSVCIYAQDGILGVSFPVTDDGSVDNMEAVYNGRNVALFYNWSPLTRQAWLWDPIYFQLCDANCKPIGKAKKLADRMAHQIKAIWDGEKYFVAATVWHKSNEFYHHKSLLFMILDEKGKILKQKEFEQGRDYRGFAYIPSVLFMTGEGDTHYVVYRQDIMQIGYSNNRYVAGDETYILKVNSSGESIKLKKTRVNINDNNDLDYSVTLSENGIAVLSNQPIWESGKQFDSMFTTLDFNGEQGAVSNIKTDTRWRLIDAFEYLNDDYYIQIHDEDSNSKLAYTLGLDSDGNAKLSDIDHGIINDSFTTFVSGNFIFSCYFSTDYQRYAEEIVLRRHGIKGGFIDRITPKVTIYTTPFYQKDWSSYTGRPTDLERFYYRAPAVVSVGTHSYFMYVSQRTLFDDNYVYINYEYRARKLGNEPFTKSRVVYARAGTKDVLPKTRLVMWDVANVKTVWITLPDGTTRFYAPTGNLLLKHEGKEQTLLLRARGTNGEKIKKTIRIEP